MSTKFCILLFVLCLHLHACHGRRLFVDEKKTMKNLHFLMKNEVKKISGVSKMKPALMSKEVGVQREESIKEGLTNETQNQKLKYSSTSSTKAKVSSLSQMKESLIGSYSSWRVPHRKRGEQNPGFNLDYAPPKTHPPAHN